MAATSQDSDEATYFSFDFTESKPTSELKLEGGAHFPTDTSCLRLTATDSDESIPLENNSGRAIYYKPVLFSKQTEFNTTITFVLKKPPNNATPADGLVFFMAPFGTDFKRNNHGGNLGIFGLDGKASKVFAIEFDLYANRWDPQCGPHLGIDFESRISIKHTDIPPSYIGNEVTMEIKYAGEEISATISTASEQQPVPVSHNYDLSYILPQKVEVGLAAATGACVAFHDVHQWKFQSKPAGHADK